MFKVSATRAVPGREQRDLAKAKRVVEKQLRVHPFNYRNCRNKINFVCVLAEITSLRDCD